MTMDMLVCVQIFVHDIDGRCSYFVNLDYHTVKFLHITV